MSHRCPEDIPTLLVSAYRRDILGISMGHPVLKLPVRSFQLALIIWVIVINRRVANQRFVIIKCFWSNYNGLSYRVRLRGEGGSHKAWYSFYSLKLNIL
jgi:hypothetical protein